MTLSKSRAAGESEHSSSPPVKRRRVLQACTSCRSRKEKCDGEKPACGPCLQSGNVCDYRPNTKRRGLAPGYVRLLETLMGMVLSEVVNGGATIEALLNRCIRKIDAESRSRFQQLWRKDNVQRLIENSLPDLEFLDERELSNIKSSGKDAVTKVTEQGTAGLQHVWQLSDTAEQLDTTRSNLMVQSGSGTIEISTPIISASANAQETSQAIEIEEASPNPQLDSPLPGPVLEESHVVRNVQDETSASFVDSSSHRQGRPPLPNDVWQLVDIYFTYTHAWLPILDRAAIIRFLSTYGQATSSTSLSSIGQEAVIWAILAHSTRQKAATEQGLGDSANIEHINLTGLRYYESAHSMLVQSFKRFDLSYVQALLILSLIELKDGNAGLSWIMVGQAARIMLDIRGNKSAACESMPDALERQVFLGCFVLDTILSAHLRRRPQLQSHDFATIGPMEETGLEEWDFWRAMPIFSRGQVVTTQQPQPARVRSTFNHMCKLMTLLNDGVLLELPGTSEVSCADLIDRSRNWAEMLPSTYELEKHINCTSLSEVPHHVHLHMCYCFVLLSLELVHLENSAATSLFTNRAPISDNIAVSLSWLLESFTNTFSGYVIPPTFSIFSNLLERHGKRVFSASGLLGDRAAMGSPLPTAPITFESLWGGVSMHQVSREETNRGQYLGLSGLDLLAESAAKQQHQHRLDSNMSQLQQPRILQGLFARNTSENGNSLAIVQAGNDMREGTSVTQGETQPLPTVGSLTATDTLLGEPAMETIDFGSPLDESTFQSILLEYDSQQNAEQHDFWRNLGFFD